MSATTWLLRVLFVLHSSAALTAVYAESDDVEHILKRLEHLESKVKDTTDAKVDVAVLKSIIDEQSRVIKESEERISRLESCVETLATGQQTKVGTPEVAGRRVALQIDRGGRDAATDETLHHDREPIAFMAYMKRFHTSDQYPPGAILPFEMATVNTRNAYNNTSGLFTCPSSGFYKLDWALSYYNPNTTVTGSKLYDRSYTLDVDFVIVYLNQSDTAGVTNPNDEGVFMPYLSKFSGFKISQ